MTHSCRLFSILAIAAVLAQSTAALAQPSNSQPQNPKPSFVVWVHTGLPDQGAPTLDVADLERYFAAQLDACHIENVVVSETAKIPNPAPANLYLLDLSVSALQLAERVHLNGTRDPVFNVDLSLVVKNLQSGQMVGATGERYVYHLSVDGYSNDGQVKRRAIYSAAENLAGRFVDEWAAGKFGQGLAPTEAPSSLDRTLYQVTATTGMPLIVWVLLACGIGIAAMTIVAVSLGGSLRVAQTGRASSPPPPPPADPEKDRLLKEVIAFAEKAGNFSEEWLASEARRNLDVLLRDAEIIYARHAERALHKRERNKELKAVATYAARRCGLDYADIYAKLQRAEDIQHELLRTAQQFARERAAAKPAQAPPPTSPEKVEAEHRAKARQQELDALEHERQKKERELEVERVGRQIRDSQTDLRSGSGSVQMDEASRRRQKARNAAEEAAAIQLDATDAAADAAAKKVSLAQNKCVHVFQDIHMRAGEKRARIQGILDSLEFRHDILPLAVQEFMEEGYQEAEG